MADLDTFRKALHGDLVTPSDDDYAQAIARWATNAVRRAKLVAFVKDADDIALALKYATDAGLRIAVRGGGHSPAGASSVEDGLVIDLSRYFTSVRIDPEARLAFVEGGVRWASVDEAAIKHGLATVAGTINTVSTEEQLDWEFSLTAYRPAWEGSSQEAVTAG